MTPFLWTVLALCVIGIVWLALALAITAKRSDQRAQRDFDRATDEGIRKTLDDEQP